MLAQWDKEYFTVNKILNQATISRLLINADCFTNLPLHRKVFFKKQLPAAALGLEDAFYIWIYHHTNCGRQNDDSLAVYYAEKLQVEANEHRAAENKLDLKFSDGWVSRFKSRYGLFFRKVHGEAMSVDDPAIEKLLPGLRSTVMT